MQKWQELHSKNQIGLNLLDSGEMESALKHFNALIEISPKNAELYFWRGRVYRDMAQAYQTIESAYENGREVKKRVNTEKSIEHFNLSTEDYRKALEIYEKD